LKPTLAKLLRRLERRKRLHDPKFKLCTRCNAAPGHRGILVLASGVLEQLERDESGRLLEPVFCPSCLVPPLILLPDNQR
jgi:uncharacterized protein with PIN domain